MGGLNRPRDAIVRTSTLGGLDPVVVAALDIPLFVCASALAALGVRSAAVVATGWMLIVTGGLGVYATVTTEAGWGVLISRGIRRISDRPVLHAARASAQGVDRCTWSVRVPSRGDAVGERFPRSEHAAARDLLGMLPRSPAACAEQARTAMRARTLAPGRRRDRRQRAAPARERARALVGSRHVDEGRRHAAAVGDAESARGGEPLPLRAQPDGGSPESCRAPRSASCSRHGWSSRTCSPGRWCGTPSCARSKRLTSRGDSETSSGAIGAPCGAGGRG